MEPVWRVLIFLAPLCPICQNMSFDLRQLEKDFAGESVEFVGVFPNASTTEAQIATFQQTYGLDMTMGKDTAHWADALGARWTPRTLLRRDRGHSPLPRRPGHERHLPPAVALHQQHAVPNRKRAQRVVQEHNRATPIHQS